MLLFTSNIKLKILEPYFPKICQHTLYFVLTSYHSWHTWHSSQHNTKAVIEQNNIYYLPHLCGAVSIWTLVRLHQLPRLINCPKKCQRLANTLKCAVALVISWAQINDKLSKFLSGKDVWGVFSQNIFCWCL